MPHPDLRIGDPSNALRVVDMSLEDKTLTVTAYAKQAGPNRFTVRSAWKLTGTTGAKVLSQDGDLYSILLQTPSGAVPTHDDNYFKVRAELRFANR